MTEFNAGEPMGPAGLAPSRPWWERHPGRLEYELAELDHQGIRYERDETAFAAGVARIRVWPEIDGETFALTVTYPDLYPWFRFVVHAESDLGLIHHRAPLGSGALCLLDRPTEAWNPSDTVAGLFATQLPRVLATGRIADGADAAGMEVRQAEPFGEWYRYGPFAFAIDGDWRIPPDATCGEFSVQITQVFVDAGVVALQGTVLEVRDQSNRVIAQADQRRRDGVDPNQCATGRWVRVGAPLEEADVSRFFDEASRRDSAAKEPTWNPQQPLKCNGHELQFQLRAVVFPEEHAWRDANAEGWVFVLRARYRRSASQASASLIPRTGKKAPLPAWKPFATFVRAGRAGRNDLAQRVPHLFPLREASVAMVGLGCLGAPSALELARAQVAELRLLDGDFVDPGTAVRWPQGLSAAGHPKVFALGEQIGRDYPYTRVVPIHRHLGGLREFDDSPDSVESDVNVLDRFLDGSSLVFDASAELGVQYLLSSAARERGIPYLLVAGTQGGWGGRIVRVRPEHTGGCLLCAELAIQDGTIPSAPADPSGEIQPAGCGDRTFTAAGFDMVTIAMHAVRMAVSTLCEGHVASYPTTDWDVAVVSLRGPDGEMIAPHVRTFPLMRHPRCPVCSHAP